MSTACESIQRQPPDEASDGADRRRRRPLHQTARPQQDAALHDSLPAPAPRHLITRGVLAIPILADGSPGQAGTSEGLTVDIGRDGVTFEISVANRPATTKWFLGIENDQGDLAYTTVKTRATSERGHGLRVEAQYVAAENDPLRAANLVPRFDPESFRFRTPLPTKTLEQWRVLGVMQQELLDCVIVCPVCQALPTLRRGCRACSSLGVESVRLIHHFACAHVDLIETFETDDGIVCPKCRTRALVVGADYEFLRGPYTCSDCGWTDEELENIARCMACGSEFPEKQGLVQEVIGYHVERLEPLDLLPKH